MVILVAFAPVVSLAAGIAGSEAIITTTHGGMTSAITVVLGRGFDQAFGSITSCLFGQDALLIIVILSTSFRNE
jgi:hypothetical protein